MFITWSLMKCKLNSNVISNMSEIVNYRNLPANLKIILI